jgi:anti-sigma regulatory factor (Ser/Thr protein kinase)
MASSTTRVIADATIAALPAVRETVAEVLDEWEVRDRRADALLVVDELVANTGQHVGGHVVVDLTLDARVLRIVVTDQAPDFRLHTVLPSTERYGLRIIDASVDRWGVAPVVGTETGKAVWAEFDLDHPPPAPDR